MTKEEYNKELQDIKCKAEDLHVRIIALGGKIEEFSLEFEAQCLEIESGLNKLRKSFPQSA